MNRTSLRNLEEPCALLVRQLAAELESPFNTVDASFLGFAFGAVDRVDPRMTQTHCNSLQGPTLASRVQRNRHRRSGAERCQEQVIRRGARIGAADGTRLVGKEPVRACFHSLREPRGHAANNHCPFTRWDTLIRHSGLLPVDA
jgi:hypothetical protein